MYNHLALSVGFLAEAIALSSAAVIASIKDAQRLNPDGVPLEVIQKTASEKLNADVDPDDLLNGIRDLFRAGRVLHARDPKNQNLFRLPERLEGLHWMHIKNDVGMFLDVREEPLHSNKSFIVGWLNYRNGLYSARIVSVKFQLTQPIPTHIATLDDAVYWVQHYGEWVK